MLFLYLYYSLCDFNDNQIKLHLKGKTIMRQFDEGEKREGEGERRGRERNKYETQQYLQRSDPVERRNGKAGGFGMPCPESLQC